MAPKFHKGALGSPFQLEYYGNEGMETGPAGRPSEMGPRIGSGVLGDRVLMEVERDGGTLAKGRGRGRGRGRRGNVES